MGNAWHRFLPDWMQATQSQGNEETEDRNLAMRKAFVAVLNHELRTPLSGLIGVVELLRDQELPGELRDGLDTIHLSSQRMLTTLSGINDLLLLKQQDLRTQSTSFDLRRCLEDSIALFRLEIEDRGLTLTTAFDAKVPSNVIGDEPRVRYILLQLLDNALKFSTHGVINVSCQPVDGPGHGLWLQFTVRDQGRGIPSDQLDQLFTLPSQPTVSSLRQGGNIGQGLPLCRHLVEALGGKLSVSSSEGEGSAFTFMLPFISDHRSTSKVRASSPNALNVLVAEDSTVNQKVILALLQKLEIEADLVVNGAEAIEAARSKDYDLILMDIEMPEVDGISATKTILNHHQHSLPPIIVPVTATVLPNDTHRFAEAGMTGLIQKPVTLAKLRHHIAPLLKQSPADSSKHLPSSTHAVVDFAEFRDLCGDDLETQKELVALFIEEGAADIERIRNSAVNRDLEELKIHAHRLVGSSRTVGARQLADLCSQIELDPHLGANNLSKILSRLNESFQNTLNEFKKSGL